jgi:hypothetical protein
VLATFENLYSHRRLSLKLSVADQSGFGVKHRFGMAANVRDEHRETHRHAF